MSHKLYTDGGARGNPGPAGLGAVLLDTSNATVAESKKYIGSATNNEAEYSALLLGLKLAQEHNVTDLECYLDSELVVKQLNGQYKVKNDRLKKLFDLVLAEKFNFSVIHFNHVPRDKNKRADELVNSVLDENV